MPRPVEVDVSDSRAVAYSVERTRQYASRNANEAPEKTRTPWRHQTGPRSVRNVMTVTSPRRTASDTPIHTTQRNANDAISSYPAIANPSTYLVNTLTATVPAHNKTPTMSSARAMRAAASE